MYSNTNDESTNTVSWPAIIAGLFGSMGLGALLSLLSVTVVGALVSSDIANAVPSVGSLLWIAIAGILSLGVGGLMTGYFSKTCCRMTGALQGVIMWSLSLLLGLMLVSSGAGLIVAGSGQLIGSTLSLAGKSVQHVVPNGDQILKWIGQNQNAQFESINNQIKQLLKQYPQGNQGGSDNGAAEDQQGNSLNHIIGLSSDVQGDLLQALKNYLNNSDDQTQDQLRQAVTTILTQNTSLTPQQADFIVKTWQKRYQKITQKAQEQAQQFKEKAIESAKKLGGHLSKIAGVSLFVLLLGLLSAMAGGAGGVIIRSNKEVVRASRFDSKP